MSKNIDKNNSVEVITGDKIIIAGIDPNINPSLRKDESGRSKKITAVTSSLGDASMEDAVTTHQACDNSGDRPTGMLNFVGMNGIKLEAGAAGISMVTGGNITMMPGGRFM